MKEQLIKYVDLLFAGAADTDDIKQEILQNTLDRYDDLVQQGKSPQAAYSLAIAGIGDISELLNNTEPAVQAPSVAAQTPSAVATVREMIAKTKPYWKRALRAIGICLYILCPVPLFFLRNELGLCGLLVLVAIATALMIVTASKTDEKKEQEEQMPSPGNELHKAIRSTISVVGLCFYFIISFLSGAWHITWLVFPIVGAVQGLVKACLDLKEANHHEA